MRSVRRWVVVVTLGVAFLPAAAEAATLKLGLGGDYWTEPRLGLFELTLAAEARVGRRASLGGRFGGMLLSTRSPGIGVPVDLILGIHFDDLYLEVLGGPWIFPWYYYPY